MAVRIRAGMARRFSKAIFDRNGTPTFFGECDEWSSAIHTEGRTWFPIRHWRLRESVGMGAAWHFVHNQPKRYVGNHRYERREPNRAFLPCSASSAMITR